MAGVCVCECRNLSGWTCQLLLMARSTSVQLYWPWSVNHSTYAWDLVKCSGHSLDSFRSYFSVSTSLLATWPVTVQVDSLIPFSNSWSSHEMLDDRSSSEMHSYAYIIMTACVTLVVQGNRIGGGVVKLTYSLFVAYFFNFFLVFKFKLICK